MAKKTQAKKAKLKVSSIKHPNSRKAMQLSKQTKKLSARNKSKLHHLMKHNLLGEKLLWFRDHLKPGVLYAPQQVALLIEKYLCRFDEELNQIQLKHSLGHRKNRQHASREDIIKLTKQQEREEFNTCGIEMPNLLSPNQVKLLVNWNGELRFLQNFKFGRITHHTLQSTGENEKLSSAVQQATVKLDCKTLSLTN